MLFNFVTLLFVVSSKEELKRPEKGLCRRQDAEVNRTWIERVTEGWMNLNKHSPRRGKKWANGLIMLKSQK